MIIIVQMIVEPLVGLRQERILEKQIRDERVIDHRIAGGAGEVRIDGKLRRKFGFSVALLDDRRECTFGLRLATGIRVACDVWRARHRDVLVVVVKVIVVLRR